MGERGVVKPFDVVSDKNVLTEMLDGEGQTWANLEIKTEQRGEEDSSHDIDQRLIASKKCEQRKRGR